MNANSVSRCAVLFHECAWRCTSPCTLCCVSPCALSGRLPCVSPGTRPFASPSTRRRTRRGFILPLVMVCILVVATLAATLQTATWHATRQSRLGFAGERALHAADAAITAHLSAWDGAAFASMPIGARTVFNAPMTAGLSATVTLVRTSLNGAFIQATATSRQNGVALDAERSASRAITLRNPPLPLDAPLTLLGSATFAGVGAVSAVDEMPPGWSTECTAADSIDAPSAGPTNIAAAKVLFDGRWTQWLDLARRTDDAAAVTSLAPVVTALMCATGTGEPWRGTGSVAACTNEWGARAVAHTTSSVAAFVISQASRHQGVLMIDGDLVLDADLEVNGLLLVRGAVDATVGRLRVHGAALVRDDLNHGSRFGFATRVRYSRCALRRALSATGAPAAITTGGWLERF